MPQKLKDAKQDSGLSAERVIAFLRDNPDFFAKHPEVLDLLRAPGRELGDSVADLQLAMIDRLRGEIGDLAQEQRKLLSTTRANLQTQSRIHECVLALLSATSFEQLIQTVTTDFAIILDLDVVALCIEATGSEALPTRTRGLVIVPPGTLESVMGRDRRLTLRRDIAGDPELFGPGAALIRSDALVRLKISTATPPALLAFGSRNPERFDNGQATELLDFLASVLEHVVRIWLHLPD